MDDIALEVRDVRKSYGHVHALNGVDCYSRRGEIVGLIGDNGAGKSTLLNIMAGGLSPDRGEVLIGGVSLAPASVSRAKSLGLEMVYQDLALAPHLTVLENVFIGSELLRGGFLGRLGWLDRKRMAARAYRDIARLGVELPSMNAKVTELSGGQRQAVAVAKAAMFATRVLLLDEPTAALGVRQSELVHETIRSAASSGLGVIVVSHDVASLLQLADRVYVLRQGEVAHTSDAAELTVERAVSAMVGGHAA